MKSFKKILKYALNYKRFAFLNIIFNILAVIFELLSMLLFVPFLNILFNQTTDVVTTKPEFALTKEYFENYFNYTLSQYIEDENKAKVLLFVCDCKSFLFLQSNFFGV